MASPLQLTLVAAILVLISTVTVAEYSIDDSVLHQVNSKFPIIFRNFQFVLRFQINFLSYHANPFINHNEELKDGAPKEEDSGLPPLPGSMKLKVFKFRPFFDKIDVSEEPQAEPNLRLDQENERDTVIMRTTNAEEYECRIPKPKVEEKPTRKNRI